MLDEHPRIAFRLAPEMFVQVQQLAARHAQSLSQICRDALTLLMSDVGRYQSLRNARLAQHAQPPTPEQEAAFAAYCRTYVGPDLDALMTSLTPP